LAAWLLSSIPVLIALVSTVSVTQLVVQGGIGLLLLGIDAPWTRIPWDQLRNCPDVGDGGRASSLLARPSTQPTFHHQVFMPRATDQQMVSSW